MLHSLIVSAELRTGVFSGVGMRLLPEGDPRSETLPEPNTSHMRELAGKYVLFSSKVFISSNMLGAYSNP